MKPEGVRTAAHVSAASSSLGALTRVKQFVVPALSFTGILVLGAAVAAGRGEFALVAVVGVVAALGLTTAYLVRPLGTVLGLWVFLLFQPFVVTLLGGKAEGLGSALTKAENPVLILLVVVSLIHSASLRPAGRMLVYLPAIGYLLAGLSSSLLAGGSAYPTMLGAFLGAKTYAIFVVTLLLPWTAENVDRVFRFVLRFAVPVGIVALVDFVLPGPFRTLLPLGGRSDVRFGFESARGIFPIPALLASFMFCALAALLARFCYQRRRTDLARIAVLSLAAILSLRFKAILGVAGAFATVAWVNPKAFGRKLGGFSLVGVAALVLGGTLILGVARQQVDTYLTGDRVTPRGLLFSTSYQISKDKFPLGVGFGRFGSAPSENPYSRVYEQYGLSTVRGLSQEQPTYLNDTSWPTILGESGFIGLMFYAGGLLVIGARLLKQARDQALDARRRMVSLAGLATVAVFLLDSTGRPAIFDAFTALTVGLFVGAGLALGGPRAANGPSRSRDKTRIDDPQEVVW